MVFYLLSLPVQHRRHHRLQYVAAAQAWEILQRYDPADGRNHSLLAGPPLFRCHRLCLQAQQLQHGADPRHGLGPGPDPHPRRGRLHQNSGHAVRKIPARFTSRQAGDRVVAGKQPEITNGVSFTL
jgi:hypothetical protein